MADLLQAAKEAAKLCRCRGAGKYQTNCSMCHDSTWDHICDDEQVECRDEKCIALRAAISAEETRRAEVQKGCPWKLPVRVLQDQSEWPLVDGDGKIIPMFDYPMGKKNEADYLSALINSTAPPSREALREIADKWQTSWRRGDGLRPTVEDAIYFALLESHGMEDEG